MGRKTVSVAEVVQWTNNYLATPQTTIEARRGVIGLCDQILHHTGNYAGFTYLESEYLPADQQTSDNVLRPDLDDTRRRYSSGKIGA
jgi:hypothetical protein